MADCCFAKALTGELLPLLQKVSHDAAGKDSYSVACEEKLGDKMHIYIYLNDPKCKNGCERVVSSCRLFGSTNLNSIQLEPSIYLLIGSMCWFTWSMVPICSKDATLNELTR